MDLPGSNVSGLYSVSCDIMPTYQILDIVIVMRHRLIIILVELTVCFGIGIMNKGSQACYAT